MKAIFAILFAFTFSACALISQSPSTAHLAVTIATMKVVEAGSDPVSRAERVIAIATEAQYIIDNQSVTIDALEAVIIGRLNEQEMTPSDRLLADALVMTIADELRTKVGLGLLSEDQRLTVSTVLSWVVRAAGG